MPVTDPLGIQGLVAGRYEIGGLVHRGAFAALYRARHQPWGEDVAIKFFAPQDHTPPEARSLLSQRFLRAGGIMASLSASAASVVHTRDGGVHPTAEAGEQPYIVMEWLEGVGLENFLDEERQTRPTRRSLDNLLDWFEMPLRALTLSHATGIVHADLKPASFWLCGDRLKAGVRIKLLDFTQAKEAGARKPEEGEAIVFLAPNYAAPEQFRGDEAMIGPWTDVFAMALILVELMVGQPVLVGRDVEALAAASADPNRRPTPRTLGLEVSDQVEDAFSKALAVQVHARFQDMNQFHAALLATMARKPAAPLRTARSTMVVVDAADRAKHASAGSFEAAGGGYGVAPRRTQVVSPTGPARSEPGLKPPRVRVAHTQVVDGGGPDGYGLPQPVAKASTPVPAKRPTGPPRAMIRRKSAMPALVPIAIGGAFLLGVIGYLMAALLFG